jgi:acetyl-CoA acetyltransferase
VVGVAEAGLGLAEPGTTPVDLMATASVEALAEAGLSLDQVDAVFAATSPLGMAPLNLIEYLGLRPKYIDGTQIGGASAASHLNHARIGLEAGQIEVALVAYGSIQRSVGRAKAAPQELDPYEMLFSPAMPVAAYALATSRHMHTFGTTEQQLAEVAVAARSWAMRSPRAWSRDPLTVADVLASPPVASPLKVRDCCLTTDGGGAMVVTTAERARHLRQPQVHVLGVGEATSHRHITSMPELTATAAQQTGARAYAMAGLGPEDIDLVGLYDAFTITPILFLEDLGFCAKGDGGAFVEGGRIAFGGDLPVNTNGGGLSYNHPGMYGLLLMVEVVRQLRGECGLRQVNDAHVALAHANGGVLSSQATVIFGTPETLA